MNSAKLLVKCAEQAVLVTRNGEKVLRGHQMKELAIMERNENDGISIVIGENGCIADIGYDTDIGKKYQDTSFDHVIDANGSCIVPGLVDAHTHPVWAGDRVHEFAMKLAGASYMDIHNSGGGINFTVRNTQQATEQHLLQTFMDRLTRMRDSGTTLVECKSGYGLDWESEYKMLRVIQAARTKRTDIDLSSTYCAAHSVPAGSTAEEATEDIVQNQVDKLKTVMEAGDVVVDNIDVFCEKGVFSTDQSKRILLAGKERLGLNINFHGDELHATGSAEMGAEIGALGISHLEEISAAGIAAMSESGSVAVLLPTTAYMLRLTPPPVRALIDSQVPVALGSDFNPNAYCYSMPMVMHLACVLMGMDLNEAMIASTINAAASLGKSHSHGSLEPGKVGDLVILNAPRWEHLIYQFGATQHIIKYVIKNGVVVVDNGI